MKSILSFLRVEFTHDLLEGEISGEAHFARELGAAVGRDEAVQAVAVHLYERDAHIKRAEGERILARQLQRVNNTADDDELAAVTNSLSI